MKITIAKHLFDRVVLEQQKSLKDNYMMHKLLEKAIQIAVNAHYGQTDKAGMPYIFHPLRVMNNCCTTQQKIVAILHDTIEDTSVTAEYLIGQNFSQTIVEALQALTKQDGETYENFIGRISANKLASYVKIRDIKDNMDTSRLSEITETDRKRLNKYAQSLHYLEHVLSES